MPLLDRYVEVSSWTTSRKLTLLMGVFALPGHAAALIVIYLGLGGLDFVDNRVDPATGTIHARAVLPNPDRALTPGLFARVQLEGSAEFKAMLVDDKAILTDQDRKYVYVLGPDNKAMRKDIVAGRVIDGLRVVDSGLEAEDSVIIRGMQKIFFPGMPVQPKTIAMDERAAPAGQDAVAMK